MSLRLSESAVHDLEARGLGRFTTPLGYRKDGSPFYLIGGASPDDPSNSGEGGSGGTGETGGEGGSEGQGTGSGKTGEGSGAGGKEDEKVSKSELDSVLERMKAADRRAAAAEAKAKELEEKDLSEQEKVAKRLPELEQQVNTLTDENKGLKAKVAFLESNTHSWHNPEAALKLVDLSGVYTDDGEIDKKALKKAMEDLAKENTFLVKSANDDKGAGSNGQGGSGNGSGGQGQGSSGSPAGSGNRGGSNGSLDEAALRKKYPALNL